MKRVESLDSSATPISNFWNVGLELHEEKGGVLVFGDGVRMDSWANGTSIEAVERFCSYTPGALRSMDSKDILDGEYYQSTLLARKVDVACWRVNWIGLLMGKKLTEVRDDVVYH